MIKRTIEISQQPVHLSVRLGQLTIQPFDAEKDQSTSIPCEDIGLLLIDEPRTMMTQGAMEALCRAGAVVVVCGRDHLPAGVMLPVCDHGLEVSRLRDQIAMTQPLKKRVWQQLVVAKIEAQGRNLPGDTPPYKRLAVLAREVKSGDPSNVEAQAAKVYWSAWLAGDPRQAAFRRDKDGKDIVNAMLNYGYAVVRAAVARALVAAGLQPALGVHHSNRANPFCLADDLLEPLRPLVDAIVRDLARGPAAEQGQLDQPIKAHLLSVLTLTTRAGDQTGPLMVNIHRMVGSLLRCMEKKDKRLLIPTALDG